MSSSAPAFTPTAAPDAARATPPAFTAEELRSRAQLHDYVVGELELDQIDPIPNYDLLVEALLHYASRFRYFLGSDFTKQLDDKKINKKDLIQELDRIKMKRIKELVESGKCDALF